MARAVQELGGRPDATVVGSRGKASLPYAALANTYMANILDYDDTYFGHPGCTVVPPALAASETVEASGQDFLTAVVVGYEIHSRVAASIHRDPDRIDLVSGPTSQTFGSVAAASKILLPELDQTLSALGIAGATAPVPSNSKTGGAENVPPTMKVGFYACSFTGVLSALLARKGITGPHNILDGETGFWRMISADACDFERMTLGLGEIFEILNVAFKPYSCCRWFHSALDCILHIFSENDIKNTDVTEIAIKTLGGKQDLEYMKNQMPKNIVAAEFSLPYSAAVALSSVKPGPEWFSNVTMSNNAILQLAKKITCEFNQKRNEDKTDPYVWPATVEVKTLKGNFQGTVQYPKGSPRHMMSDMELDGKFAGLAHYVLDDGKIRQIKEMVSQLEDITDMTQLTSLLST
jgi:2-methylcitrate dehydratase PrpD